MKVDKKFVASLGISAVFILLAVSKVDFGETWKSMRDANYVYVIPSAAAVIASLFVRAIRWKFLLSPIKDIPIGSLFAAAMIGAMGNSATSEMADLYEEVKTLLNLPEHMHLLTLLTLGVPDETPKARPRKDFDKIVSREKVGQPF